MFAAERTRKIKEILLEYKHVDINTLCSLLDCSIATVRRDLDKLETEGFLTKAYGGALLNEDNITQVNLQNENDPYIEDKKSVAKIATTLINNDDIIFLGPGTTCLEIARSISDKIKLTIITNNFGVVNALADKNNINVIFLGGSVENPSEIISFTTGPNTVNQISSLYINKAFFSVSGVSLDFGYTLSNISLLEIFNAVFAQSENCYVVADSSKFDQRSMIKLADLSKIKNIITNVEVSAKYKEYFFSNKIAIYTSFNAK